MHAGTEQLLTIRDGGLVDAGIAQHVANCTDCGEQLAQLRAAADALRALPQLSPPDTGWSRLTARLDAPARRRQHWWPAVAAAALIAVAIWQAAGDNDRPSETHQLSSTDPVPADAAGVRPGPDTTDLQTLVAQSRQLEQLLRRLDTDTPRVMNAGTAGTIAGLQDGIAYIDYGLSYNERLGQSESEQLWRQRVGLMNTLVQVRGAQLQQIPN